MSYQVLARKWRPQDFSSIIGQEPIVTALRNALTEGRIAQAYLFSGIRGVGKTTAARVLAKALNCEKGPAADPCNECDSCRQITGGADLDVIEVDAATYSKVEQVRELTESLRYGPARNRYKVVVLDEVHRLSRQAFDALLKIVEEPPAHLVFVFATTESDAVPATILSRCQEFQFRRVPSAVLASHLRKLCDAEEIKASDTTLRLVARAGEGSVRDSIALLDQLATFGSGTIDEQEAKKLLGGLDSAIFLRLLRAILEGSHGEILAVVGEVEANGWDPHHVYSQFLGFVRDGLHLALGGAPEAVELPREESEALAALAWPAGYENLLRLSQLLLAGEPTVRRSEVGSLALEILWLRAAELPKLTSLEDFLTGRKALPVDLPAREAPEPPTARAGAGETRTASPGDAATRDTATRADTPRDDAPRPEPSAATPDPEEEPSAAASAGPSAGVGSFRKWLGESCPPLAARLRGAELRVKGGVLYIHPPDDGARLSGALERNAEALSGALAATWGPGMEWKLAEETTRSVGVSKAKTEEQPAKGERQKPPAVQAVLDIFDGKVEDVQPAKTRES